MHLNCLRWAFTISDKSTGYCSPLITYNYLRNRGTRFKQRSKLTILYKQVKDKGANSRFWFCARYKKNNCVWWYVRGVALDYFIITLFWMKLTYNFSLISIFLLIFSRAVALLRIRRKMAIREKLFVNFIQNSVIIDTNSMCRIFFLFFLVTWSKKNYDFRSNHYENTKK